MIAPTRSKSSPSWLGPALVCAVVVIAAIAIGLYASPPQPPGGAPQGRLMPRVPGPAADLPTLLWMLGVGSVVWYAAALALPLLLLGARKLDPDRLGWVRVIALALGAILAGVSATAMVQYFVDYRGSPMAPGMASYLPVALRQNLLAWVALAGVVAVVEARRRSAQAALERERLRAKVAEQRLIVLTAQLQPHFLFNTLQGISTLIHRDADAADEMLSKLSDLLRDLLRHRDQVVVALGDEVRYTRTYLEIAKLRFGDRLTFSIDVPAALHSLSVPLFILQPLVENALAHGIGARIEGGSISVRAAQNGTRLILEVSDDGAGLAQNAVRREGLGLMNTRERLAAAFGDDQSLSVQPADDGGVVARVDIPARALSAGEAAA